VWRPACHWGCPWADRTTAGTVSGYDRTATNAKAREGLRPRAARSRPVGHDGDLSGLTGLLCQAHGSYRSAKSSTRRRLGRCGGNPWPADEHHQTAGTFAVNPAKGADRNRGRATATCWSGWRAPDRPNRRATPARLPWYQVDPWATPQPVSGETMTEAERLPGVSWRACRRCTCRDGRRPAIDLTDLSAH
jgi:hypothetical protein